jgi:N-acetylneuraminic acid mutarotase
VASAEVWNVTTKTWSVTGQMSRGRERHTATLLPDGRVLVTGGYTSSVVPTATCEIFNPASGTWSNTGSLSLARAYHTAVLLNDGRVMVAGGETTNAQGVLVTTEIVEIYNPASGTWATASPCASRSRHAAALLADGRVLIAGGLSGGYPAVPVAIATAQIYNPQTGAWSNAPSMAVPAAALTLTVLTNGRVLATGGYYAAYPTTSDNSQVYNPTTNTWLAPDAGGLVWARSQHTATRLPSGTVLVCGGGGPAPMATAEIR